MHRPPSSPQIGRPKSPRLIARFSVRLRREGGSLSITIPRHVVRHWELEPGARLVLRSTDAGILLYPRYFLPYVDPAVRAPTADAS
jgi:antitoxin component of MazEF toxin-antitoxin module